jgi:hypothetical protein
MFRPLARYILWMGVHNNDQSLGSRRQASGVPLYPHPTGCSFCCLWDDLDCRSIFFVVLLHSVYWTFVIRTVQEILDIQIQLQWGNLMSAIPVVYTLPADCHTELFSSHGLPHTFLPMVQSARQQWAFWSLVTRGWCLVSMCFGTISGNVSLLSRLHAIFQSSAMCRIPVAVTVGSFFACPSFTNTIDPTSGLLVCL